MFIDQVYPCLLCLVNIIKIVLYLENAKDIIWKIVSDNKTI